MNNHSHGRKIFKRIGRGLAGATGLLLTLCLVAGISVAPVLAAGVPPIPDLFSGSVKIGSVQAPIGTVITAYDVSDGNAYAGIGYVDASGNYGIAVSASGSNDGDTIQFYVGGIAAQTGTFYTTESTTLNLSIPSSDDTLSNLAVSGTTVTGFAPGTLTYNVVLAAGTTIVPTVTATATDAANGATAVVTQAASVTGSATVLVTAQNTTVSQTYTINFSVAPALHTDDTLSNLAVSGTTVTGFAPGTLTYNVVLAAGTTIVPTVTATATDAANGATAVVTQAASVTGSATVLVTAQNTTVSQTYTINFSVAPALHTDDTLSNLAVSGTTVTGFAPGTLTYNVVLAAGTTIVPTVTATATDAANGATAVVTQAASVTGSATVLVTAQNTTVSQTYTINFSVAPALHTDDTLSNLAVSGTTVTGFAPGTLTYNVVLAAGTTIVPTVTATATDAANGATAVVTQAASVTGSATVLVTAQNTTVSQTYTINFSVAPALHTDDTLSNLAVSGTTVTGFAPGTLTYNVVLAAGTTIVPTVTATATDAANGATAVVTQAASVTGSATVLVTAQNTTVSQTYTINFSVAPALHTDDTLSNLAVSGTTVTGFAPGTLTYNVVLAAGTTIVPTVTATATDAANGATAVVTQAASVTGSATVLVTAQNTTVSQTYTINFSVAPALHTDDTLSNLAVSGTTVTGFAPGTLTYNVVLAAGTTIVPTVTATATDAANGATAVVTQAASVTGSATVLVTAQNTTVSQTYTINFSVAPALHTDDTLSNLAVSGTTVTGFAPGTLTYNVVLAAGTTIVPTVTATATDAANGATAVVTQAASVTGSATVLVTAQNTTVSQTYTINFSVAPSVVLVTSITVTGAGNATVITKGATLQMNAAVLPANATNLSVTWSVATLSGGTATISSAGLLTGTGGGTVTVTASANDASGKTGTEVITIYDKVLTLKTNGWSLISTDNYINDSTSAFLGSVSLIYKYSGGSYVTATIADLTPVNAIYVKTTGAGLVGLNYSGAVPGPSTVNLVTGWNLISSATVDYANVILSPLRYVTIGSGSTQTQAVGLATLVSQGNYNLDGSSCYIDATTWANLTTFMMSPFDGYWVYMNAATSFGVIPQ